jgi:outer membrane lipoprotein-sorting protein
MKYILIAALALSSVWIQAQEGAKEAKETLKKASDKIKAYENALIQFEYLFENKRAKPPVSQNEKGEILISKNNYFLTFMGTEQLFDGKKTYNILREDQEVQVFEADEDDEGLTPAKILDLYQSGYSYSSGGTQTLSGKVYKVIILTPKASAEIDYIEVYVSKTTNDLHSIKQVNRDGSSTKFTLVSLKPNQNQLAKKLIFNKKDFPGFRIVE